MNIEPIAYIHTPFTEKFGIPRQGSVIPNVKGRIEFTTKYRNVDAVKGIDDFDYLWLIWSFNEAREDHISPTVRPPRLGGNRHVGVFASRSPFRPNRLGLTSVRLLSVDRENEKAPILEVGGVDMVDGTPVYDIKPYSEEADAHTGIRSGFIDEVPFKKLEVVFSPGTSEGLSEEEWKEVTEILSQDPRPAYQRSQNPERVYGMSYKAYNIRFQVEGHQLKVLSISKS